MKQDYLYIYYMEKLKELISKCKAGFSLEINEHKNVYESVEDYLNESLCDFREQIPNDIYKEIVRTDNLVHLQFYPNTPVGFYIVLHYDLDMAINEALKVFSPLKNLVPEN
jgi:hypothetical protein